MVKVNAGERELEAVTVTVDLGAVPARTVKSAERTLVILETLGTARGPVSVTDLHRQTGYPRSSLHQLLHTMADAGWIQFTDDASGVEIGYRALIVGTSYLDRDGAVQRATRTLELIRDASGYTAHYARLQGANVIYLATREASESHRLTSRVGRQLPAHATALGKALLAELTPDEVSAVLPAGQLPGLTINSVTDAADLAEQLEETRARGYSIEREENTLGVSCVSAVVPYRIPATDAISCSIPLAEASATELDRVAGIVRQHAWGLADDLRRAGIR